MELFTLEQLLLQNKPAQIILLEELLGLFSQSPYMSHAFVRGSITRNELDRASDLDIVLAYDGEQYPEIVKNLDILMEENFNTLFPGWQDTIVADFGGLGFVYLIERQCTLFQVDIYILPTERAMSLQKKAKSKMIYRRDGAIGNGVLADSVHRFITDFQTRARTSRDFYIEVMVLALLIRKRIKRGQLFLNYSETHLLISSIRNFFRSVYDPEFVNYGWYHIQERMAGPADDQRELDFLESLVKGESVHTFESLQETMMRFLELAMRATPELVLELKKPTQCYYKESGFTQMGDQSWNRAYPS